MDDTLSARANADRVRGILSEYDGPKPFDSAMDAADMLAELVELVRPLVATEHVEFNWSVNHGRCYDCGLPAAFRLAGAFYDANADDSAWKRCAVCAANDAAVGEQIVRIEPLDN